MDRQEHWDKVYRSKHHDEVSWFQPRPETSSRLIAAAGLGKSAPVIDVGGGASLLVDRLLDEDYTDITVLDVSAEAIRVARERLGGRAAKVQWRAEDVTKFVPPRQYGIWHDRAVFHFLTDAAERDAYVATAAGAVRDGGCLIVATFAHDGPDKCSGLEVVRYSPAMLAALFSAGFELAETVEEIHLTPSGAKQPFVYCRFVRT